MAKLGLAVAVIATVIAVPLSGCRAGKFFEEVGPAAHDVEPHPVEPVDPGINPRPAEVEPVVPASPSGEKLADKTLPAMKTVKPTDKKAVLDAACTANDIYGFATASTDDERVQILQNQGRSPAALLNKIVEVYDQLRELNDDPQWENGIKVTADTICLANDIRG